jgi:hypothetical protein
MSDPTIADLLTQCTTDEAKLATLKSQLTSLDNQLTALTAEAAEKRKAMRAAYRAQHEKDFADLPWQRALLGMDVQHTITLPGVMAVTVRVPTGAIRRAIESFLQGADEKLKPISLSEVDLLAWVTSVHLLADPNARPVDLRALDLAVRLERLRALPDMLINRVAGQCATLSSYLSVVMEMELGNS